EVIATEGHAELMLDRSAFCVEPEPCAVARVGGEEQDDMSACWSLECARGCFRRQGAACRSRAPRTGPRRQPLQRQLGAAGIAAGDDGSGVGGEDPLSLVGETPGVNVTRLTCHMHLPVSLMVTLNLY